MNISDKLKVVYRYFKLNFPMSLSVRSVGWSVGLSLIISFRCSYRSTCFNVYYKFSLAFLKTLQYL